MSTETDRSINNGPTHDSLSQSAPKYTTTAQDRERLHSAYKRMNAACAEYAYFNPTIRTNAPSSQDASSPNHQHPHGAQLSPPNPEVLKRDLQTLYDRVLALDSIQAWLVYERVAREVRDMANDEYSGFDWELFQECLAEGLIDLREHDHFIEVDDLLSLPLVAVRVGQNTCSEREQTPKR